MSSTTFTFDLAKTSAFKEALFEKGFLFSTPPYTHFHAKGDGVSCALYTSGKLVVSGKRSKEWIESFLEPFLGDFSFTLGSVLTDFQPHMGSDEAGKGDFFGPLSVAAIWADEERAQKLLKMGAVDSKRLSDDKAIRLAEEIKKLCPYHIVRVGPEKYNELYPKFHNLNRMLAWMHGTALEKLSEKTGSLEALVDQFYPNAVKKVVQEKKLAIHVVERTRAESDVVVAGASILARADFLLGMKALEEKWGFKLPKGATSVKTPACAFLRQFGKAAFRQVAKEHFKTWKEVELLCSAD
jgi:ribonuclease HIII